jgi:hypothetical protein
MADRAATLARLREMADDIETPSSRLRAIPSGAQVQTSNFRVHWDGLFHCWRPTFDQPRGIADIPIAGPFINRYMRPARPTQI